ncbi:MAG: Sec-independent protein translocase subunit TatA [Gammaproteobacteria bacterium]|jgi:sec-independent protein translocase protein TatA|nr:Sec-independent protein translocase subunit TatA [Gammaproteobacteria bacterium]
MSFGIKELIVILVIVMLVFGTKKIRNVGTDVGGWIRDFKKALKDGEDGTDDVVQAESGRVIEGDASVAEKENV